MNFPQYKNACGWNSLLEPRKSAQTQQLVSSCDVLIVGAGYTGIAAARRWAEHDPAAHIVLLDASTVGEGNPGRNSGFLLEIALANDADTANMQRMRDCNRLLMQTMQTIRDDTAGAEPDCQLARCGTYRAAAGATGISALQRYREFLDAAELPCESLSRDQLEERIGSRFYQQGLYSPHCYLAQPAALIRALAARLPASVQLIENTPALSIEASRGRWDVSTPHGSIAAGKLVLANNAFCKGLGIGASRITAMYTYAALTGPLPADVLATLGSDSQWGLLPAHRLGSTLRKTVDGRLLIRSLYGYEREADNNKIATVLRAALQRRFPQLGNIDFEFVWAGATGFTYNGSPLWGEVSPGLHVSAGCNGGGVVKGTLFGRLLADAAFGLETPDMAALFGNASWMPPEPIRALGFRLIAGIERRRARAEV
jgi:glycine/D-amino acid oxidase-like deaminating enzyme